MERSNNDTFDDDEIEEHRLWLRFHSLRNTIDNTSKSRFSSDNSINQIRQFKMKPIQSTKPHKKNLIELAINFE